LVKIKVRRVINVIYPSIDLLLNKVGSKYLLVNIVARRAKEMSEKKNYQLKEKDYVSKKEIGRALEEISEGLIKIS
jgi:DNA-directed RNA polymerase subunit omega